MTPSSPDGYNHNIEVYVNEGWNLILATPIVGIYKGDDYADDAISSDSEIKRDNIKAVYYYISGQNKYVPMYPNAQDYRDYVASLTSADEKTYIMFSSVWVYSDKSGVLKYRRVDVPKYHQVSLKNGWNFLTITSEMKGKSINQLRGDCNFEKIYWWNGESDETIQGTNWKEFSLDFRFSDKGEGSVLYGTGMVVKVSNNCKLGASEGNVPSVPNLP